MHRLDNRRSGTAERASSPPVQTPSRSRGRKSAPSPSAHASVAPFKLEKIDPQKSWSKVKLPAPQLDELQGCVGAVIRWAYSTAFVSGHVKIANGCCFILTLILIMFMIASELIACSYIASNPAFVLGQYKNFVFWRQPLFLLLSYFLARILSRFLPLNYPPMWRISRHWNELHFISWLLITERLGHASQLSTDLVATDARKHVSYVLFSILSPLLAAFAYELSFIWGDEGADKDVMPPSQWFGFSTALNNLRYMIVSKLGEDMIDQRVWMQPDPPQDLCRRVVQHLNSQSQKPAATNNFSTVCEGLKRDLWVDYLADSGDSSVCSAIIANMIFAEYDLPDIATGSRLLAPRGDILMFGGDTAYPTSDLYELNRRLLRPFNKVLKECADRTPRVLLGIPGNHDWYDGLQGFSRLFRLNSPAGARIVSELSFFQKIMSCFHPKIQTEHFEPVQLHGYTPLQSASYWNLPVAPHIDFVAIDRMLKEKRNGSDGLLDRRQQEFFQNDPCKTSGRDGLVIFMPDPLFKDMHLSHTGIRMFKDLLNPVLPSEANGATEEDDLFEAIESGHQTFPLVPECENGGHLIISGDIHHYQRIRVGSSQHIIAGGGGAFLHPSSPDPRPRKDRLFNAELANGQLNPDVAQWPSVEQCKLLVGGFGNVFKLLRTGVQLAIGVDSGWIPHVALFCVYFFPMMFQNAEENCDTRCGSYHMIMLSKLLPLQTPLVSFFNGEVVPFWVLKSILAIFLCFGSLKTLKSTVVSGEWSCLRSDLLTGHPKFPFLWLALLLSCILPYDPSAHLFNSFLNPEEGNNQYEIYTISVPVVLCAVLYMSQFVIQFNEILVFQVHKCMSRKILQCLAGSVAVAVLSIYVPMVASTCNMLLKSIYILISSGSTGTGIPDGCNIKAEREKYPLDLHPDCTLEMALSVNFAFLCAQLVMFLIGVFAAVVFTHLELPGELLFASMRLPFYRHFLRLRVHADGSRIDAYCIGVVDPYGAEQALRRGQRWGDSFSDKPVLVDSWSWNSRQAVAVSSTPKRSKARV